MNRVRGPLLAAGLVAVTLTNLAISVRREQPRTSLADFERLLPGDKLFVEPRLLTGGEVEAKVCTVRFVIHPDCAVCSALSTAFVAAERAQEPLWLSLGDSTATEFYVESHGLPRDRVEILPGLDKPNAMLDFGILSVPTRLEVDAAGRAQRLDVMRSLDSLLVWNATCLGF